MESMTINTETRLIDKAYVMRGVELNLHDVITQRAEDHACWAHSYVEASPKPKAQAQIENSKAEEIEVYKVRICIQVIEYKEYNMKRSSLRIHTNTATIKSHFPIRSSLDRVEILSACSGHSVLHSERLDRQAEIEGVRYFLDSASGYKREMVVLTVDINDEYICYIVMDQTKRGTIKLGQQSKPFSTLLQSRRPFPVSDPRRCRRRETNLAMDSDEEDFVFVGTPLEREEDMTSREKKSVAEASETLRSLPPWKQENTMVHEDKEDDFAEKPSNADHSSMQTPVYVCEPKDNLYGLGFDPYKHAPEFREKQRLKLQGAKDIGNRKSFSLKDGLFSSKSGKVAPGFGIGALEEADIEDEDVYASGFDYEVAYVQEDEEALRLMDDKKIVDARRMLGEKPHGGLPGFRVALNSSYQLERFDPPVIPKDFVPQHKFTAPRDTVLTDAPKPFIDDPAKQERFEQFLKDKYQGGLRSKQSVGAAAEAIEKAKSGDLGKLPGQQLVEFWLGGGLQFSSSGVLGPPPSSRTRSKLDSLIVPLESEHNEVEEMFTASDKPLVSQPKTLVIYTKSSEREDEGPLEAENIKRPVDLYKAIFSDDSDVDDEPSLNQVSDPQKKIEAANTILSHLMAGGFLESLGKELGMEVPTVPPVGTIKAGSAANLAHEVDKTSSAVTVTKAPTVAEDASMKDRPYSGNLDVSNAKLDKMTEKDRKDGNPLKRDDHSDDSSSEYERSKKRSRRLRHYRSSDSYSSDDYEDGSSSRSRDRKKRSSRDRSRSRKLSKHKRDRGDSPSRSSHHRRDQDNGMCRNGASAVMVCQATVLYQMLCGRLLCRHKDLFQEMQCSNAC
ncbi:G patch domain-containing protein [Drosera capensis]